jgi:hypothetical protein
MVGRQGQSWIWTGSLDLILIAPAPRENDESHGQMRSGRLCFSVESITSDNDLSELPASQSIGVGGLGVSKAKPTINHRTQPVEGDGAIHGFKRRTAAGPLSRI